MNSAHPNPLVAAYLGRLERAASALPSERRDELVGEIRAHIDEALRDADATDEATVRNILDRLGPPREIALAAVGPVAESPRPRGKLELAALLVLALGGIVPVVGWGIGAVLVLASGAWSAREKGIGLALGLLGALAVFALVVMIPANGGGLGSMEIFVLFGWGVVAGWVSAAYLAVRLRHPPGVMASGLPMASGF